MSKAVCRRSTLILRHWFDSALLVCFAAAGAALLIGLLQPTLGGAENGNFGRWASWLRLAGPVAFVTLLMLLASLAPRQFLSAISGLRYFPYHCGLVLRCWAAGCLCVALVVRVCLAEPATRGTSAALLAAVVYTGLLVIGVASGGAVAWLLRERDCSSRRVREEHDAGEGGSASDDTADVDTPDRTTDPRVWLTDDRPISTAAENLVPAHLDTARRILQRLSMRSGDERAPSCNVALVGPYGCGKTSICNLVHSEYEVLRREHPDWPRLLFCRFEAWRYLTPHAALRGLIDAAANRVLEEADECVLWSLGEQYVQVARETGFGWARAIVFLLGGDREPEALLRRLGELLFRLNRRLVVFVDDLDRVEATSADQQQAVVRALNQFQTAANVQYVLAVGPAHWAAPQRATQRPLLDLLKLTRFQELVPEAEAKVYLGLLKRLRDKAQDEPLLFLPWAEGKEDSDPLDIPFWHQFVPPRVWEYSTVLAGLLRTPRDLKTAIRETHTSWEGGLRGEINWYNLLLANVLKVAEPGVFEWIIRDKETFLRERISSGRDDAEAAREQTERLEKRLRSVLQVDSDFRYEAVTEALNLLFPVFGKKIDPKRRTRRESQPSTQDLASGPAGGQSYFHRFSAGCVPADDPPDRPVLEYIKTIREEGFDAKAFEKRYLDSFEKLTGPLNKIVQFAPFLGEGNVLAACDAILDWASRPESIRIWPEPNSFHLSMAGDIYHVLSSAEVADLRDWLHGKVVEIGRQSPLFADSLIHKLEPSQSGLAGAVIDSQYAEELRRLLAETIADEFVQGGRPLGSVVECYPFALSHLVWSLQPHPDYDNMKGLLTRKLIEEWREGGSVILQREVLLALTHTAESPAVMAGRVPPAAYKFTYDKGFNESRFDMPTLLHVLKKWHVDGVDDPLGQRVLGELAVEYGLGGSVPSA